MTRYDEHSGAWRADRVGSALLGTNPTVLRRLQQSFAVIGDVQFLPGYSVVIVDRAGVDRLSDLPRSDRLRFLEDLERTAEAVERACSTTDSAFRRVNVEILGNTDPFLHVHVWPRFGWEPAELMGKPVWLYPPERWSDPATGLGPQHEELRDRITAELDRAVGTSSTDR
ncbi:HIT family protein [Amnibacterium kyonggiense]|uniref:HIT family protein n=1 Tax=Amnibacterium kyonggiense TaxID=595671 RepID=UPI0031DFCA58